LSKSHARVNVLGHSPLYSKPHTPSPQNTHPPTHPHTYIHTQEEDPLVQQAKAAEQAALSASAAAQEAALNRALALAEEEFGKRLAAKERAIGWVVGGLDGVLFCFGLFCGRCIDWVGWGVGWGWLIVGSCLVLWTVYRLGGVGVSVVCTKQHTHPIPPHT
jgi:hypothetical protein